MAGDVPKQANFVSGSGVTAQCGRKFNQTSTAPAMAPSNCAAAKGARSEKSPVFTANAKVTAGLMFAAGLPQAMAVNTPVITAKAHPVVMASQPVPSALLRLSNMLATAPLPIRMRIIVPMNSPKKLDAIGSSCAIGVGKNSWQQEAPAPQLQPVERPGDGLLPKRVQFLAPGGFHLRAPGMVHAPAGAEIVDILKESDGESGGVGGAEGGGFLHGGAHHRPVQNIRLELHEEIVGDHAAILSQDVELDSGVHFHGLDHLAGLQGG